MEAMAAANDPLRLESQVCFPLYACAKEVVRRYREPLEPLGLTYTQYLVMMTLWEYGDMTEGTLGKILHLDSGTLTPLLKRLEKQELLRRTRAKDNERKLLLELTASGKALREQAEKVPGAVRNCIPLNAEELAVLKSLLCKAVESMHG